MQAPIALVAGLGIYLSVPACLNATSSASPTPSSPSSCTSNPTKPPRSQTGPHSSLLKKARQVDYLGALFLVLTISLFLYGLNGSGGRVASTPLLLSGASLLVFLLLETTVLGHGGRPEPIIPLAILSSRGVLLSCLAQLGFMSARWTVLFYAPIYALAVRGMSAAASGSVLIPTNAGFGAGGLIVGYLHIRRAGSFWLASLVALGLFIVALAALSAIVAVQGVAFAVFAAALFLNGLFTGAMLNYTLNHMLHLSPPQDHFVASSLLGTFRGFAGSFGSAIGGGVFARALTGLLTRGFEALDGVKGPLGEERRLLVDRLVASPALIWGSTDDVTGGLPPLTDAERVVAVDSYRNALSFLWRAAVVLAVAMAVVQAATGWHGPPDIVIDEEEIREAVAEHDPEGEA